VVVGFGGFGHSFDGTMPHKGSMPDFFLLFFSSFFSMFDILVQ
jgi:hypothetical protein